MANATSHTDKDTFTETTLLMTTTARQEEILPGIMSEATLYTIQSVVNGGILPVLVLFGVICNVINMAVFVRQGLGDRINLCLFSLALSDSGFLMSHLASRIYSLFYLFSSAVGRFWEAYWFRFTPVYHTFLNTSNSFTMVISLERCICVISPLHAKHLFTARQMAAVLLTLFSVNLAGNFVSFFTFATLEITDPITNTSKIQTTTTEFFNKNRHWVIPLFEVAFNTVIPTICLVVVIAATIVITVRMRAVLEWRKETAHGGGSSASSSANQREAAVTRMLLVVCVVYTCCITPSVIQAITRASVEDFFGGGRYNNIFFASLCITHFLESVNCSINFIIYYTMSTRFRETLREIVRRGDKKRVSALSVPSGTPDNDP